MNTHPSLLGSWVSFGENPQASDDVPDCTWHVVDNRTCVYEQRTEMGLSISWFQYWQDADGILRYPLCKTTRSMFKTAEYVPIQIDSAHLIMNGYRFELVAGLSVPERRDHFPGARPDEDGLPTPHTSKARLQEYLSDPPIGEQEATDGNPKAAP